MEDRTPEERRKARCFHRVISGLEKGGPIRLITLTSSDTAANPIQQDFRRLIMRLRRRKLLEDYIKVVEVAEDGREHIHMAFRGSYIEQAFLSYLWQQIRASPIVDIRAVKPHQRDKRRVSNYLAKYMSKAAYRRYSWSWGWVYKGFVAVWKQGLQLFHIFQALRPSTSNFFRFLELWKAHLHTGSTPATFLTFLAFQVSLARSFQLSLGHSQTTAGTSLTPDYR